jgi:hypothetical protein
MVKISARFKKESAHQRHADPRGEETNARYTLGSGSSVSLLASTESPSSSGSAVSWLVLATELTKVKAPAELVVADAGISLVTTGGGAGGVTGAGSELLSPHAANSTVAAPSASSKGLGK